MAADLCSHWLPRLSVVKVGGDVKLQQLTELPNDMLRGAVLVLPLQLVVRLDYFCQLMCQVIFRSAHKTESHHTTTQVHKIDAQSA